MATQRLDAAQREHKAARRIAPVGAEREHAGDVERAHDLAGAAELDPVVQVQADQRVADQQQAFLQRRADVVGEFLGRRSGSALAAVDDEFALEMAVRVDDRDVATSAEQLAAAFPAATGRLAIFIHGLAEIETDWERPGDPIGSTYGSRLASEGGYTPLFIRYNSGLHISTNGARLSSLASEVVAGWPVEVEAIALVGHSMGGLVARSACHQASVAKAPWVRLVTHIVSLGTPHHGAPLEKVANVAAWALARVPETRALARLANFRSAGIKDLRHGSLTEEDWLGRDPDRLLEDDRTDIPFLEGAGHYFIGATLTADVNHPVGRLLGDLLVRTPSAAGRGPKRRHLPFEAGNGRTLGGLDHFDLLNHPVVAQHLVRWLA